MRCFKTLKLWTLQRVFESKRLILSQLKTFPGNIPEVFMLKLFFLIYYMKIRKYKFKEKRIKPLNELWGNKIETKWDKDDKIVRRYGNTRKKIKIFKSANIYLIKINAKRNNAKYFPLIADNKYIKKERQLRKQRSIILRRHDIDQ